MTRRRLSVRAMLTGLIATLLGAMAAGAEQSQASLDAAKRTPAKSSTEWYDQYQAGKNDIRSTNWEQAELKLVRAKAIGPSPGPRVLVSGGLFVAFSPDFYLGTVYAATNRYSEAHQALTAAANQKLNTRSGEFATLNTQLTAVARSWFDTMLAAADKELALGNSQSATRLLQQAKGLNVDNARADEKLASVAVAERFQVAINGAMADLNKNDFSSARTKVAAARYTGYNNTLTESLLASINTKEFEATLGSAEAQLDSGRPDLARKTAEQARQLKVDDQRVDKFIASIPATKAPTPPITTPGPAGPIAKAPADPKYDPKNQTQPKQTPGPQVPSAVEISAMRLYFAGDYDGAINVLGNSTSHRALFYRACSRVAIMLLRGTVDARSLAQARQEFSQATEADTMKADSVYISPRILQQLRPVAAS